jgi:ribosomal protein S18 acetylase RimI-like enzyme
MTLTIRPCTPEDAVALSVVAAATFLETYAGIVEGRDILHHCRTTHAVESYDALLADPARRLFIAETDEGRAPVGFMLLGRPDLPVETFADDMELTRIYTLHRFHGTGLGQGFMNTAVGAAREAAAGRLLLAAYSRNARALAFYGRNGFRQIGTRVFHVGDNGYDDYVLAKDLAA